MSRWFRVYSDLIDDPKFIKLGPDLRSALLMTWCVASGNDGRLPSLQDIAIKFRLSEPRTLKLLNELRHCGFIDDDETGSAPHNWSGRQYLSDVSTNRVKQFRKRQRNVSPAVSETPPDTEQITEAEKEETRASALASDWPPNFRDVFWVKYPNKVGKPDAFKKLDRVRKTGVPWAEFWGGLERYCAKTDDRPWCNPATWINQQRWTDQPANGTKNGSGHAKSQADKSVVAAADRILERLQSFDEPIGQN